MNESWAIGLPGHSTIGTRVRFVISSVSVPLKPGSTKPAVAWTMSPSRPRLLLCVGMNDRVMRKTPRGSATWMHRTGRAGTGLTATIERPRLKRPSRFRRASLRDRRNAGASG